MPTEALTIYFTPPLVACPKCRQPAEENFSRRPHPQFVWTDGWIERRDGSPIPSGWAQCPRCQAIAARDAWKPTGHRADPRNRLPPTQEPSVEALRAHIQELLMSGPGAERVRELQVQLWWLANARRRGAESPPRLEDAESRNLFRVMRPPDAPGFEGGLRRIEAMRELGLLDQARRAIGEVREKLDRLEALIDQGDTNPQLWDASKPIEWPPLPSGPSNADQL